MLESTSEGCMDISPNGREGFLRNQNGNSDIELHMTPPLRFSWVTPSICRSAYPTLPNFAFLATLGLKTIVSLTPEPPSADLERFCAVIGANSLHIPVENPSSQYQMTAGIADTVLQVVSQGAALPALVHCLDGRAVVGTVVRCLRKLQAWDRRAGDMEALRFLSDSRLLNDMNKVVASFVEWSPPSQDRAIWVASLPSAVPGIRVGVGSRENADGSTAESALQC